MKKLYLYIDVVVTTNVNKTIAMKRTCNLGGAHNVLRNVNHDFTVDYLVLVSKTCSFTSQF